MKKIYLSVCAMLFAAGVFAQADVTFRVDMTPYITAGGTGTINASTVKIAGNFTTRGASVPDWDPTSSPAFTNVGGNVYSVTISFPSPSDTLQFKFLLTSNTWGNCNDLSGGDTQECLASGTCTYGTSDNRALALPQANTTICFDWNTCNACSSVGVKQITNDAAKLLVSPNPAVNSTSVSYVLAANENVQVKVYNVLGAEVVTLVNEAQSVGAHKIEWNTANVDKGLYTVVATTSTGSKSVRVAVQ